MLQPISGHRPPSTRDDFTIDQQWETYTAEEHAIWRTLSERQGKLLVGRASDAFMSGLDGLGIAAEGIPDFRRLSDALMKTTGWQIVAVPGLVPDATFFDHLANRRFPSTCFIRTRAQLDYLQEPDVFHDIYGHVPLLMNPIFADYMEAYGKGGLKAVGQDALHYLARLYWYTVEFGLINTPQGMRIYGSGIASSKGESIFSLDDPSPNRIGFDLMRVMQTTYRIDDYQEGYFVIDSFEQLFDATRPDFTGYYADLKTRPEYTPGTVLPTDRVLHRGTGAYHHR
jgi:phenylalanine-4-hydroxylase